MKLSNSIFFAIIIIAIPSNAAELIKWKDENGKTHYGTEAPASVKTTNLKNQISIVESSAKQARVILYSTSWCGYCKKARSFMNRENISFVEYDIEKSASAKRAYEQAGGNGVPLLIRGKRSIQGFSESNYREFFKS